MKMKQVDAEYTYDYELDIVNIKVKHDYIYNESVDLDVGVFLDFDINNFPVNLEILSASKRLNISKDSLKYPNGEVNISIINDTIKLDVYFKINDEKHALHYSDCHEENLQIDNLETCFALT